MALPSFVTWQTAVMSHSCDHCNDPIVPSTEYKRIAYAPWLPIAVHNGSWEDPSYEPLGEWIIHKYHEHCSHISIFARN